ncbi:MAG: DNA polymerase III subunit delta' [Nitrospinae bacterium]|nr:DNA polymerase III subunit delta' [Nitrospinota bacterium]
MFLKLSEIAGQDTPIRILKQAAASGDMAHAYLFAGPEGVGKKTTALAWARAMMCQRGGDDACGQCAPCRKAEGGNHPDIIFAEPEIRPNKKKKELDMDHVRELITKLQYKPYEARRKVVIVDGADRMNLPAANAFLKTLEEPPGDAVIILVASNMGRLPATIISRCQPLRFGPLHFAEAVELFTRTRGMTQQEAAQTASLCKGAPGLAGEDAAARREVRDRALKFLSMVAQGDAAGALRMAQELDKGDDKATRCDMTLEAVAELVRDLITVKITGECDKLMNMDIKPAMLTLAAGFSARGLERAFDKVSAVSLARQWNINPLLCFSLLFMEMRER